MAQLIASFIVSGASILLFFVLKLFCLSFLDFRSRPLAHRPCVIVHKRVTHSAIGVGGLLQDLSGSQIRKYLVIFAPEYDADCPCKLQALAMVALAAEGGTLAPITRSTITRSTSTARLSSFRGRENGKVLILDFLDFLLTKKIVGVSFIFAFDSAEPCPIK